MTLAGAAVWAEEVRAARRRIVAAVESGVPLSDLIVAVPAAPDAGPPDAEVLAETRILVLCEARPGAGKVASRRALAAHGVEELARFADVPPDVLAALDRPEATTR